MLKLGQLELRMAMTHKKAKNENINYFKRNFVKSNVVTNDFTVTEI